MSLVVPGLFSFHFLFFFTPLLRRCWSEALGTSSLRRGNLDPSENRGRCDPLYDVWDAALGGDGGQMWSGLHIGRSVGFRGPRQPVDEEAHAEERGQRAGGREARRCEDDHYGRVLSVRSINTRTHTRHVTCDRFELLSQCVTDPLHGSWY